MDALDEKYFINKINRAALPDMEPLLYVTMTDYLEKLMNRIKDNGAALISNLIKMSLMDKIIKHASRDGKIISITFANNLAGEEEENKIALYIFKYIAEYTEKWYGDGEKPIMTSIYKSGMDHVPDSFIGHITDMCMQSGKNYNNYILMLKQGTYDACIPYQSYIRCIIRKALHCDKVMFYDNGHGIIATDKKPKGKCNSDRAHVLACGLMFIMFGILNVVNLND